MVSPLAHLPATGAVSHSSLSTPTPHPGTQEGIPPPQKRTPWRSEWLCGWNGHGPEIIPGDEKLGLSVPL